MIASEYGAQYPLLLFFKFTDFAFQGMFCQSAQRKKERLDDRIASKSYWHEKDG